MNFRDLTSAKVFHDLNKLVDQSMTYGLVAIAFCLVFVRLNHIVEYAFFGLLIAWVLWQWQQRTIGWVNTSLDIPILLYLTWALLCVPFAVDPGYSFGEWKKVLAQILMFYFVVQTVKHTSQVYSVLLAVASGVVVLACVESFYFLQSGVPIMHMGERAGHFWGSSQWFSGYLLIGLPILWFWWHMSAESPRIYRMLVILSMGICMLGLFLSQTRGAWIALAIQIVMYACLRLSNKWGVALGASGIVVGLFLTMISVPEFELWLSKVLFVTYNTPTMQIRFNTWSLALQDLFDKPLMGIGLGKHSFSLLHPELQEGYHANLHNTFLSKAVQIGIPGFVFFSSIFAVGMLRAANLSQRVITDVKGQLAVTFGLIIIGVIVRNLFDDMFIGTAAYLFWLLLGLLYSVETPKSTGDETAKV